MTKRLIHVLVEPTDDAYYDECLTATMKALDGLTEDLSTYDKEGNEMEQYGIITWAKVEEK